MTNMIERFNLLSVSKPIVIDTETGKPHVSLATKASSKDLLLSNHSIEVLQSSQPKNKLVTTLSKNQGVLVVEIGHSLQLIAPQKFQKVKAILIHNLEIISRIGTIRIKMISKLTAIYTGEVNPVETFSRVA